MGRWDGRRGRDGGAALSLHSSALSRTVRGRPGAHGGWTVGLHVTALGHTLRTLVPEGPADAPFITNNCT